MTFTTGISAGSAAFRETDAVEARFPMTPLQQGMLAHALLHPGTGMNVVQTVADFGTVDPERLQEAWFATVRRHPLLRTRFRWEGVEAPVHEVLPDAPPPFGFADWRDRSSEAQAIGFEAFLDEDRVVGFSLAEAPLARVSVFRFSAALARMVFTWHHAILDGRSAAMVVSDLLTAYRKGPSALDRLPAAPDFRWYAEWVTSQDWSAAADYWRDRLKGVHPTPLVIAHSPAPEAANRLRRREARVALNAVEDRRLRDAATRHRVSLNTMVQGAWAVLLSRYAGEEEVLFGATRRCRSAPVEGIKSMIGPTINTVPIRVQVDDEAPLGPWLAALGDQWQSMRAHENAPVARMQSWSGVPADTPLFESIVVFESQPVDSFLRERGHDETRNAHLLTQTIYPLTLLAEAGGVVMLRMEYDPARFDHAAIERLMGHLRSVLAGMAEEGPVRLGDLRLIGGDERELLLRGFNNTARPYPDAVTLTDLLEQQATRTPSAEAVRFGNAAQSYEELHARANQLARRLRQLGIVPGTLVGVCAERSLDMVVALVAVLKAGGAYVPLDPEYPADRLRFMLDDAAPPVLITQASLLAGLPPFDGITICLDRDWPLLAGESPAPLDRRGGPADPAYMIYTSGSTGRPKGARNAHRGIVNRLLWMQEAYPLTAGDTVLQKTPFSFDVSVWEFFWPLITGSRLVLARPGGHRDPSYLIDLIEREAVTVLHFVPSMLRAFLADPDAGRCRSLREVICSGEALPGDLVEQFFACLPARLHNLYGPTEAAVDVTAWTCQRGPARATVPIGAPIANTQTYVLDRCGEPAPIGVPGELFLGGVQVGMGYWKRPDLTAERFVSDPFSDRAGARLYRTGDLARWLDDGTIEFLGRLDFQVKIRGLRIELGEIEAVLAQEDQVTGAVVVVRDERPGDQRLVGYYTTAPGMAPSDQALTERLHRALPDYMVPSLLIRLDEFPLSPNGKLDRKALPAPDLPSETRVAAVPPRNATEATLARIWAEVLKVPQVGVTDNFYGLGGDSILSIFIAVRARAAGLELAPGDVLQHPTIEGLALAAGTSRGIRRDQGRMTGSAPLTPVQRWFFDLRGSDPAWWNQAILVTVPADCDPDAMREALALVQDHHDALRLRFRDDAGSWHQWHDDAPPPPDLTNVEAGPDEASVVAEAERIHAGFDLARGPLLRGLFLRSPEGVGHRLLLVAHHLVVDGISWQILMEDLEAGYEAVRTGRPARLPPKTSSFKHWAEGLAALAASGSLDVEADYWCGVVAGRSDALPFDGDGGSDQSERTARVLRRAITVDETNQLLRQVPPIYRTQINDVLLTALGGALADWTGGSWFLVDLEGHGREALVPDADGSRTVGWFTSVFPVGLVVDRTAGPGDQLRATKEMLRRIPHRGMGYGLLRYGAGHPDLIHAPQPDIAFNYFGQYDQVLAGSALFRFAPGSTGAWHGPINQRRYAIELNAMVLEGRLQFEWTWLPSRLSASTVESIAEAMIERLRAIMRHCQSPEAGGFSPSDFPLAGLDQAQLDQLVGRDHDIEDLYPATPMQQLFHGQAGSGGDTGFEQWQYRFDGEVDPARLFAAVQDVAQRHPALRTAFASTPDGSLYQIVRRSVDLRWRNEDWREADEASQEGRLADFLKQDRAEGFNLAEAPVHRILLIRTADRRYRLVWTHHHILIDRLSWPVILGEVGERYRATTGSPGPTPSGAPPFREYVAWLQRRNPNELEAYWRQELEGVVRPIGLGSDGQVAEGHVEVVCRMSTEATRRLRQAARADHLTLNTLLQGAWALWLSRWSGEEDVVFGLAVSGRPAELPGADAMVGQFVNNVPVRVAIPLTKSLGDWLRDLQGRQAGRQLHEHATPRQTQEWSGLPERARLFESLVVFQNDSTEAFTSWLSPAARVEMDEVPTRTTYPLTLLVNEDAGLSLRLAYQVGSWSAESATEAVQSVARLLEVMIGRGSAPLSELLDTLAPTRTDTPHSRRRRGERRTRPLPPESYRAASTATERYLVRAWEDLLGVDGIGCEDNVFVLGAHSLVVARIATRIRDELRVDLPLRALFDAPTISGLAGAAARYESAPGQTERIATIHERIATMSDEALRTAAAQLAPDTARSANVRS